MAISRWVRGGETCAPVERLALGGQLSCGNRGTGGAYGCEAGGWMAVVMEACGNFFSVFSVEKSKSLLEMENGGGVSGVRGKRGQSRTAAEEGGRGSRGTQCGCLSFARRT